MVDWRKSLKPLNKPKQYQQSYTEFYKLKFKVTPDVLIPRPETELLVDEVLTSIKGKNTIVLDIGTGCGNIAISIAKNNSDVKIFATDISNLALKIAKKNTKLHKVESRIKFIQSNLLKKIKISDTRNKRLIIVTNLPYIPSARIPYLDSSVKDFEPKNALDGGMDGFELYRKLFAQIKKKSWKVSLIIGEIDYTHGQLALDEATKFFPGFNVEVKTDLAHKQRILIIQKVIHSKLPSA